MYRALVVSTGQTSNTLPLPQDRTRSHSETWGPCATCCVAVSNMLIEPVLDPDTESIVDFGYREQLASPCIPDFDGILFATIGCNL